MCMDVRETDGCCGRLGTHVTIHVTRHIFDCTIDRTYPGIRLYNAR